MIIKSRDFTYEVIERLPDAGAVRHYRCRCAEDGTDCHVAQFLGNRSMEEIPYVLALGENPAFTDLKECFVERQSVYLVLAQPQGRSLAECLKQQEDWKISDRFAAGQGVLERLILLQTPEWLLGEALMPENIYPEQEPVGFYYPLSFLSTDTPEQGDMPGAGQLCTHLETLFSALFQRELDGGLYPELEAYRKKLEDQEPGDVMEAYQSYLELMPVCGEDRKAPEKEKISILEQLKKAGKKLLTAAKLLMGAAVLLTAVTTVPKLWKEKVVPVAEAAALWKSVYVDGETIEAATEEETLSQEDLENGQVTWYWENGNLCYKGMITDGVYEGRGTLYYQDGKMEYQGEFAYGRKEGDGSLYTEEGILRYEGGFHKDKYEGAGKLYDEKNGNLIYDGEFSGGKYSGNGTLFDPWSEFPLYDGSFRQGFYDGKGVEYDNNGAPRYDGEFLLGVYHGHGIYYDASTGLVLMEGEFRNGNLVTSSSDMATSSDAESDTEGGQGYEGTYTPVVVPETG